MQDRKIVIKKKEKGKSTKEVDDLFGDDGDDQMTMANNKKPKKIKEIKFVYILFENDDSSDIHMFQMILLTYH